MMTQTAIDQSLDWNYVHRFLLIGNERGVYETPKPSLSGTPTPALARCLHDDGVRVVRLAADLLISGRAQRPEPALFAIAKAITDGDARTRQEAFEAFPLAVRTGAHLFQLLEYLGAPASWDRALRTTIGEWYTRPTTFQLVNMVLRSPRAASWNHRDALGLAHSKPPTKGHAAVWRWITHGSLDGSATDDPGLEFLAGHQVLQTSKSEPAVLALLRRWPVLREDLPDHWLTQPAIWQQILPTLSTDALLRWLPRLAEADLLHEGSAIAESIAQRLQPITGTQSPSTAMAALAAAGVVRQACEARDRPAPQALESALIQLFYARVAATRRVGGTLVIAVDAAAKVAREGLPHLPGISPRLAVAALILMAAASVRTVHLLGFGDTLAPIALEPQERLETLMAKIGALPVGRVDGAAPVVWALENGVSADAFLVLNATPREAVDQPEASIDRYFEATGNRPIWLAVTSGADRLCQTPPMDLQMMEAHGIDASVPALIVNLLGAGA